LGRTDGAGWVETGVCWPLGPRRPTYVGTPAELVNVKRLLDPLELPEADEAMDCEADAPPCEAPATAGVTPPDADEPDDMALDEPDAELPLTADDADEATADADEATDEADEAMDDAEDITDEAEDAIDDPEDMALDDPLADDADIDIDPLADAPVASGTGTIPAPADAPDAELALADDADDMLEPEADIDVTLAEDAEPLIDDAEPLIEDADALIEDAEPLPDALAANG